MSTRLVLTEPYSSPGIAAQDCNPGALEVEKSEMPQRADSLGYFAVASRPACNSCKILSQKTKNNAIFLC